MNRSLVAIPLLAFALGTGCHPKAKVAAEIDPVGVYELVSVAGKFMPAAVDHEGARLTIKEGHFVINPDGTCSSRITFTVPSGGDAVREVKATWTRQGPTLTMQWEGAGVTTGTVAENAFTMENEGMAFAYRK